MMTRTAFCLAACAAAASLTLLAAGQPPTTQPPASPPSTAQPPAAQTQQPTEIRTVLTGTGGLPPKVAIAGVIPVSNDAETVAAAKTIADVLYDDLAFEREFYMISKDVIATIPKPTSIDQVPLDRWKEVNANAVIVGSVRKTANGVIVQIRVVDVQGDKTAMGREYSGSIANPRAYAHTASDEIHQQLAGLHGVARTKLTFSSDRDGERLKGPLGDRDIKEIYISDYDGANQRRVTTTRALNITPVWAPDGQAIAYTSYRRGFQDIFVSFIYQGRLEEPAHGGPSNQNYLPVYSPDGTKIAFTSNRDGNPEIYVMNADGTGERRLTNNPAIDVTPTWSPTGNQIAWTSDRTQNPQIYIMNADGTGQRRLTTSGYCDRPTWSPQPFNEVAYAMRSGGGFDIMVYSFADGQSRRITDGIGTNESPAFSPNGRHLAFTSTRNGKQQIFTIARDGTDLRQITRDGNNGYPNWSR
jgi:TolB protein